MNPLLSVTNMSIAYRDAWGYLHTAVTDVSFDLKAGDSLAIIGTSGSGKSTVAHAVADLLPEQTSFIADSTNIYFQGQDLLSLNPEQRRLRNGDDIAMIFQEPMSALNPLMRVGTQLLEASPKGMDKEQAYEHMLLNLRKMELPDPEAIANSYPHQLSGGQRQRVLIAMALSRSPKLLIADEPTTALDVTVQHEVLSLLKKLQREYELAILFISHDLGVVQWIADRVLIMDQGTVIEEQTISKFNGESVHEATQKLLESQLRQAPVSEEKPDLPEREVLISTDNLSCRYNSELPWTVNDANICLHTSESLGIVGASGSGKSTLIKSLVGLVETKGGMFWKGNNIVEQSKVDRHSYRRNVQMVFQDPYSSLSPRLTVADIIAEGLEVHKIVPKHDIPAYIADTIEKVNMPADCLYRYIHEFSGGQRQRIAIARALVMRPKVLLLDEPTSALDVTVQYTIIDTLKELKEKEAISYLFVSHDLDIVKELCDTVAVMDNGRIVEQGSVHSVYEDPQSEITKTLLSTSNLFRFKPKQAA